MQNIVDDDHLKMMQRFKQLLARYQQNRDLISIGAYTAGADPETDAAIERFPYLRAFIQQGIKQSVHMPESISNLKALLKPPANTKGNSPLAAQHRAQ
jgi:flagellum-specific ATP synthase